MGGQQGFEVIDASDASLSSPTNLLYYQWHLSLEGHKFMTQKLLEYFRI
jgi:hypothetical protein